MKLARTLRLRFKEVTNAWFYGITNARNEGCLLYTSDAADDLPCVDLGGRRSLKKKNTHILTIYRFPAPSLSHSTVLAYNVITTTTTQNCCITTRH